MIVKQRFKVFVCEYNSMNLSMIFFSPKSLPVGRRLKIEFFHKVN